MANPIPIKTIPSHSTMTYHIKLTKIRKSCINLPTGSSPQTQFWNYLIQNFIVFISHQQIVKKRQLFQELQEAECGKQSIYIIENKENKRELLPVGHLALRRRHCTELHSWVALPYSTVSKEKSVEVWLWRVWTEQCATYIRWYQYLPLCTTGHSNGRYEI